MIPDPKNSQTQTSLYASKSIATNNTAGTGLDTKGIVGQIGMRVNLGVKTAGDNDGAVTLIFQHAANNTASEATNISGAANVATTNNTAAAGTVLIDPRATYRYLFPRIVIAGTNSPAYPVTVEALYTKQVQP